MIHGHTDISDSASSPTGRSFNIKLDEVVPVSNIDWSRICGSRIAVKTVEGRTCGNAVDEYNDSFVLINFGPSSWHEYLIPKSTVEGYDGKLLHLNIRHEILKKYAY